MVERIAAHRNLGGLEREGAGMAEAAARPIGHRFAQLRALREGTRGAGQRMVLWADLVLRHALLGQSRPVDRLLAGLDVLADVVMRGVEADAQVRLHRQVGGDEAHREKSTGKSLQEATMRLGAARSWRRRDGACRITRPDPQRRRRPAAHGLAQTPPGA